MKRCALVALAFVFAAVAQVATEANKGYRTERDRAGMAAALGNPERDRDQRPKELVDALALRPGMTVADAGTGVGYMLPWLSEAVGPQGRVLAEDIFDDFLTKARERGRELKNVTYIRGREDDPLLPEASVDVILVLDVYHHFDYPEKMLAAFRKALKPDGRLVVVEYYKSKAAMPGGRALTHIRLDKPGFIREIEASGFKLASEREHIKDRQYMLVMEKK